LHVCSLCAWTRFPSPERVPSVGPPVFAPCPPPSHLTSPTAPTAAAASAPATVVPNRPRPTMLTAIAATLSTASGSSRGKLSGGRPATSIANCSTARARLLDAINERWAREATTAVPLSDLATASAGASSPPASPLSPPLAAAPLRAPVSRALIDVAALTALEMPPLASPAVARRIVRALPCLEVLSLARCALLRRDIDIARVIADAIYPPLAWRALLAERNGCKTTSPPESATGTTEEGVVTAGADAPAEQVRTTGVLHNRCWRPRLRALWLDGLLLSDAGAAELVKRCHARAQHFAQLCGIGRERSSNRRRNGQVKPYSGAAEIDSERKPFWRSANKSHSDGGGSDGGSSTESSADWQRAFAAEPPREPGPCERCAHRHHRRVANSGRCITDRGTNTEAAGGAGDIGGMGYPEAAAVAGDQASKPTIRQRRRRRQKRHMYSVHQAWRAMSVPALGHSACSQRAYGEDGFDESDGWWGSPSAESSSDERDYSSVGGGPGNSTGNGLASVLYGDSRGSLNTDCNDAESDSDAAWRSFGYADRDPPTDSTSTSSNDRGLNDSRLPESTSPRLAHLSMAGCRLLGERGLACLVRLFGASLRALRAPRCVRFGERAVLTIAHRCPRLRALDARGWPRLPHGSGCHLHSRAALKSDGLLEKKWNKRRNFEQTRRQTSSQRGTTCRRELGIVGTRVHPKMGVIWQGYGRSFWKAIQVTPIPSSRASIAVVRR